MVSGIGRLLGEVVDFHSTTALEATVDPGLGVPGEGPSGAARFSV